MEVSGQLHAPEIPICIAYEARWTPYLVWTLYVEQRQISVALLRIKPPSSRPQPVTIPTELSQLHIHSISFSIYKSNKFLNMSFFISHFRLQSSDYNRVQPSGI
jgi:hypothetical protein